MQKKIIKLIKSHLKTMETLGKKGEFLLLLDSKNNLLRIYDRKNHIYVGSCYLGGATVPSHKVDGHKVLGYRVDPDRQKQGLGTWMLTTFFNRYLGEKIQATIELTNYPSLKLIEIMKNEGFVFKEFKKDDVYITYILE